VVIALGLAAGLVIGAPLPMLTALGLAVWQPVWLLAAVIAWAAAGWRKDQSNDNDEAAYLQAVAGELRAGASLRHAICAAQADPATLPLRRAVRLARAGHPLDQVADELARALPRLGGLTASSVRTVGVTGGRAADVFDGLALVATEELDLVRERRAATAQVRFSALIVGGIPVVYLAYAALTDRLAGLASTGSIGVVVLGLGVLFLGGGVVAIWLSTRGEQQ
jgi:Flp pilus assembly protein TadB